MLVAASLLYEDRHCYSVGGLRGLATPPALTAAESRLVDAFAGVGQSGAVGGTVLRITAAGHLSSAVESQHQIGVWLATAPATFR